MISTPSRSGTDLDLRLAQSFRSWQRDTVGRGILPVIAVAGSRGKSTVVRMIDAIFTAAHLRTATWTNLGVEIRGRRQRGELGGWSLALSRLADSTIDIAIQELHVSTINAVGLPDASYPAAVLTNVLSSSVALGRGEQARRAGMTMARAVHPDGLLVVNGDDPSLADIAAESAAISVVTSLSEESPFLRAHLDDGGSGAWQQRSHLVLGELESSLRLGGVDAFAISCGGSATMQISNLLAAASITYAVGVEPSIIVRALGQFLPAPDVLPGSFNVFEKGSIRAFLDGLGTARTLRTVLKAVNPGARRRQITVIGELSSFSREDVGEMGRLVGRHPGAIILHSNVDASVVDQFRRGISANAYPPVVIHLPTERRALNRALKTVRADDVLLVLHQGEPAQALRALERFLHA